MPSLLTTADWHSLHPSSTGLSAEGWHGTVFDRFWLLKVSCSWHDQQASASVASNASHSSFALRHSLCNSGTRPTKRRAMRGSSVSRLLPGLLLVLAIRCIPLAVHAQFPYGTKPAVKPLACSSSEATVQLCSVGKVNGPFLGDIHPGEACCMIHGMLATAGSSVCGVSSL